MTDADTTHFGFDRAARREAGRVNEVFRSVAGRYDLMNDLMSAGLHRAWKDASSPPCARRRRGPSAISTWPAAPATSRSASSTPAGRRPA